MPIDKDRIPHAGETVYLKNDPKCTAMYLDRIIRKGKQSFGFCTWTEYVLVDDELLGQEREKEILFDHLTVYPPVVK